MAVVEELLRTEENGTISFGDYTLDAKAKVEDYEHGGDLYKVKTYRKLTKLEKNGMFAYESEPGTSVLTFGERRQLSGRRRSRCADYSWAGRRYGVPCQCGSQGYRHDEDEPER